MWIVLFLLTALACEGQDLDSVVLKKPEVLNSGFIDILTNGQINASARLIRLYIGEPGKVAIPVSVYSGVSSNNFQNQQSFSGRSNEHLVYDFINPLSGLLNISLDGIILTGPGKKRMTRTGFIYQVSEKSLTGYREGPLADPATGKPVNFFSSLFAAGFYIQTGAWEKNNPSNLGICWTAIRYIFSVTSEKQLRNFLQVVNSGVYHGWSFGWGIEINNLVSIKFLYYKYLKAPLINHSVPVCQVTFNYSVKK